MQISLRTLEDMDRKLQAGKTAIKRAKEKADEAVQTVVSIAEVNSTAFSFGVINSRWGNPEFLGIPVDLGAGIALHALAFFDVAPQHMHNLAHGATSSYFVSLGAGVGRKMLAEAQAAAARLAANAPAAPPP